MQQSAVDVLKSSAGAEVVNKQIMESLRAMQHQSNASLHVPALPPNPVIEMNKQMNRQLDTPGRGGCDV